MKVYNNTQLTPSFRGGTWRMLRHYLTNELPNITKFGNSSSTKKYTETMCHYTLMECVNLNRRSCTRIRTLIGHQNSPIKIKRDIASSDVRKTTMSGTRENKIPFKWLTITTAVYIALIVATTRNNNDKDIIGEFKLLKWQRF